MLTTCLPLFALMNHFACTDDTTTIERAEVVRMAHIAGFTDEEMPILLCTIDAESDFRPYAISYNNTSFGIGQIHKGWSSGFYSEKYGQLPPARPDLTPQALMNPMTNLEAMRYVYLRSGWTAWDGFSPNCSHLIESID